SSGISITESQISDFGSYLENESDPIFSASTAYNITSFDTTVWNNKLDSESDPLFSAWDKSSGISITESQISDFGSYLETETDPVFGTSLAAGITDADTASWNSKLDVETQNLSDVLSVNNDGGAVQIKNIADPTDDQDAVTKSYVDKLENRIFELEYNAGKDTVVDCDGNVYDILKFGDQYWFAENLKSTTYNDCTDIPKVEDAGTWSGLSTPAYCWYNNDSSANAQNYGALYNWFAVNTGNLCPEGWRVPTDEDWKALEMFVGMSQAAADTTGYRGTNEGAKLAGSGLWHTGTLSGQPEFGSSGFDVVPGGNRDHNGDYYVYDAYMGYQWSSTNYSPSNALLRLIQYDRKTVYRNSGNKKYGMSVRCVRD
ncbi:MAG: fibrobacter succinogenes major paralogous domain-containing protein, partial [Bacteroidales bacterium]